MNTIKTLATPATKPTNGNEKTEPLKTQQVTTPEPVKFEAPKTENQQPPLEDRLHKLNILFDLQKKYGKLAETKAKLEKFSIAQNVENSELTISDDEDNQFTTTNPIVILEVRKLVLQIISKKTDEMADQIKW